VSVVGTTTGNPSKNRFGWRDYPVAVLLTVLVLGVVSLAMLVWTDQLGQRQRVSSFSTDALRSARTRSATAHLYLEESIIDKEPAKRQRSLMDFAEAARLCTVLLDGGKYDYGYTVQPLVAPALRREGLELTRLTSELIAGAHEKLEKGAGPGTPLDVRYNAIFEEFQSHAEKLERMLEDGQADDHAKSRHLFYGMLVAWASILGVSILGLVRRERRRRQADEALQRANAALEMRVAERTAQLRQLNEQLGAELNERKQAEEALRTSEERLAAIVASAMDAIITVDEDQRVILFNAAAEKIFGCPASEAIGKPLDRFIPDRVRAIHRRHIHAFGSTGATARSMGTPGRVNGQRVDGEEFPCEATISQASTRGQKLYTVILRDVTQREKAEEVARLYAKTREREQLRMEFFANISHELRTPLALILGPVWKVLEAGGLADDARQDLEALERNARLLLRHVNDLLDLAKIDAGRMTPKYAEVDLAELTRVTASNFTSLASERDVRYVIEVPDSLVAEVDPPQVERVLLNLLSNAFKFTPPSGSVGVAVWSEGDRAILEVEDTGPGVPAHLRDAIFERFRQVEGGSARPFGGTGLGLSIAKEFVALHGGRITVADPVGGQGSVFRVELTLRAPSGTEVRRTARQSDRVPVPQMVEELGLRSPTQHHAGQAPAGNPVILVVEDNVDMNAFIARALSRTYHVVSAFDGQEGLEKALEVSPDLIVCDVMMPRMSGDQMVRELRRRRALDDVPIVLLTAKVDDEELRAALLKDGAQDYLNKPISVEHLMAKVERLLADRRRAAEKLQRTREVSIAAEEASQAKDQFLATLSHELRTPLMPVLTAISLLARDRTLSERARGYVDVLRRNVELESRLIDDLLDLNRIARGKVQLDRRPVELRTIIERAIEVCRPDIDAKRVHFGVDFGPLPYLINADAARLQQVFWNLLKNSIKFTPNGGCVGVRCRPDDDQVVIEIEDSGIGIDPAALGHIFEAFAQAEPSIPRQFGGLGLGLAISKTLVEMHGGTIEAHSEGRDCGATFMVRLPRISADAPDPSEKHGFVSDQLEHPGAPLRILLVEDHGDTADMLVNVLELEGHQVEAAGDVATALKLGTQGRFDLLVSDLGLPDGSGLDLMRELRSRGHALPGIALSGYGQETDIQQSRAAGFHAHVVKPVDPERLLETLNTVVHRSA
jgi:PAS domain S-box-containing protein